MRHNYVGQEHLLLAFAKDPSCSATRILTNLHFDPEPAVRFVIGEGDAPAATDRELTPRALKALELALTESYRRKDLNLGTEHMLLGLIREGEGIGCRLLTAAGVGAEAVERELEELNP